MEPQAVGKIVALIGKAFIKLDSETIPLEIESPVYKGSTLVTGDDSHVEVRFVDDTMLSQGASSEVSIDSYVFEEPGTPSSILLNFTEGTLRTITGKIAEENPEGFEIKSPLATLGIRGTDIAGAVSQDEVTFTLIKPGGPNHFVVIKNPELGDQRFLFEPGTFVTFRKNLTEKVQTYEKLEQLLKAVPFTTLPNNGLSQKNDEQEAPMREDEELIAETSDQGERAEQEIQELQDAIEAADPNAPIDLPATGAGGDNQTSIDFKGLVAMGANWQLYNPVSSNFKDYKLNSFDSDSELLPEFFEITPKKEELAPPPVVEAQVPVVEAESPLLDIEVPSAPLPAATLVAPETVVQDNTILPILFIGGSGDDVIIGNAADNIIFGGGGIDQQFGVGGDDSFIILGTFGPNYYLVIDEAGNQLSGGNLVSNVPDGLINGGPGIDTLVIYGDAYFAPTPGFSGVQIVDVENVEIHSTVTFTPVQLEGFDSIIGVDTPGENPGEHILVLETEAGPNPIVDFSSKTIDNLTKVILQQGSTATEEPTIVIDATTMDALNNTDNDAIPCPPYTIEGSGRVIVPTGTNFTEFITTYGDDFGPDIKLGNDPSTVDDSVTTKEETPIEFNVLSNDDGNDEGDVVSLKNFEQADHGTVSAGALAGDLVYTPDADFYGTDSFTYTVFDSGGLTGTGTVKVTVDKVNQAPTADDDTGSTTEDTPVVINLLDGDSDLDGSLVPGSVSITSGPAHGSTSLDLSTGEVTYTPEANYFGTDSFTYTVNDDDGATSNTATVSISIRDDDPKVASISYVDENGDRQENVVVEKHGTLVTTLYGSLLIFNNGEYEFTPYTDFSRVSLLTDQPTDGLTLYAFSSNDSYLDDQGKLSFADAQGNLSYDKADGIGVKGGSSDVPNQINHNSASGKTEALAIQLPSSVDQVSLTITRLIRDEGPENSSESGYWQAFDQDGNLVGSGYINEFESDTIYNSDGSATITIETGDESFQSVVLTAVDYVSAGGEPVSGGGSDSSDYYVKDIAWEAPGEIVEVALVSADGTHYQEVLTIDESNLTGDIAPDPSDVQPDQMLASLSQNIDTGVSAVSVSDPAQPVEPPSQELEGQYAGGLTPLQLVETDTDQPVFGEPSTSDSSTIEPQILVASHSHDQPFGDDSPQGQPEDAARMEIYEPLLADLGEDTSMDIINETSGPAEEILPVTEIDANLLWVPPAADEVESIS